MGKGNYRGTPAECIMYFLTNDYNVDCELTNFKVVEKTKKESRKAGQISVTRVKWKDYSFELRTSHFNIDILAEDIIKHLSKANLPDFCYKPKRDTPMRMDGWNVLGEKFGRKRVDVGWVYHYPAKD